ncbi:MAG: hypothetical protein KDA25_03810, partial [Phycisphaerales bacterium]|nr:hypothetical protein [Phycisphaerales bacterium]
MPYPSARRRHGSRHVVRTVMVAVAAIGMVVASTSAQEPRELVPSQARLGEAASTALQAAWLSDDERAALRVFHGVWQIGDLDTPARRAAVALDAWQLSDPVFTNPECPAELVAERDLRRGDFENALRVLGGRTSIRAARLRAEALEKLARYDEALAAIREPIRLMLDRQFTEASDLTDGVEALVIRARIEGQPARDYQIMMELLGRARSLDRLYWPTALAEARLLDEKEKISECVTALHDVLALNPRCSEAWLMLGRIATQTFDFDSARRAAGTLRVMRPSHPLADVLEAEIALVQDDPDLATALLEPVVAAMPRLPEVHALLAAAAALRYDDDAMRAALARFEAILPGSPLAYATVGRHLSFARQYEAAAEMLEEAIRRQPNWPPPRIELGLMELQSGRDDRALQALRAVAELDRFNVRAANSLFLLEELATYERLETEHFIIRYQPGVDRVLVDMMPESLEASYATVTGRFEFEPPQKTVIEVLPDHKRFGVRITGMPFIHTLAACTGPVIAMEVPRDGQLPRHLGTFDWPRVLRHEFTHTVTLAQTKNRIPHWLTEAAAVSMELAPRDYDTCRLLADATLHHTLFDLDEINWAFIRPRRPTDRAQAYAQGHWMVEFMNARYGDTAIVRLLAQYADGVRDSHAFESALGVTREAFYDAFLVWAREDVKTWGLDPDPSLDVLTDEVRWDDPDLAVVMAASAQARLDAIVGRMTSRIGEPTGPVDTDFTAANWPELVRPPVEITDARLATWIEAHPDHPDLRRLELERMIDRGETDGPAYLAALERYATLRPVDPYPHRRLALHYRDSATPEAAIPHLEELDAREQKTPVFALELARLYRATGRLDR